MDNLKPLRLDASKTSLNATSSSPLSAFKQHRSRTTNPNKPYVSLSDILRTHQNSSTELVHQSTPVRTATAANSSASLCPDFLTVQALFKELELDCDEQIKLLDESERQRKEVSFKQKQIIDNVKCQWQKSKPIDVRPGKKINKKKPKRPARRVKVFHFSPATNKLTVGVLKRSRLDKQLCLIILINTVEPNRSSFASIPVCNTQPLKQQFNIDRATLQFKLSSAGSVQQNISSVDSIRRLQSQRDLLKWVRVGSRSGPLKKQNSLLDKFYIKYCGQVQFRQQKTDNKFDRLNRKLKEQYNKRQTSLMIENYESGKAHNFNELIEACKWLIDAGYAQAVYEILSKCLFKGLRIK